jgi:hypothetical protein
VRIFKKDHFPTFYEHIIFGEIAKIEGMAVSDRFPSFLFSYPLQTPDRHGADLGPYPARVRSLD